MATVEDTAGGSPVRRALQLAQRSGLGFLADRTVALLLGVGVGAMIGWSFASQGAHPPPRQAVAVATPPAAVRQLDCPVPFSPHLIADLQSGQPVTVGVFGDSFGVGVAAATEQLLRGKDFKVLKFSKEATGFTRYASLNLEDQARSQIAGLPIDIAVIDYGANDTQGIYDGAHAYALLTDGWKRAYGDRMDRFVGLLRAQGAMVYWVGLPVMRKPDYDRQVSDMQDFYSQRMTALGVPYIGVRPLSEDPTGAFNDYLADGPAGAPKLMRANDGIHMTFAGYERIAAPVVARIRDYVARARVAAQVDAPPPAPVSIASAGHAS